MKGMEMLNKLNVVIALLALALAIYSIGHGAVPPLW